MILSAIVSRSGLLGVLLTGALLFANRAGESFPPDTRMPAWVEVRAGTVVPSTPRPIEPTSFAVSVGTVAPEARFPIDLKIRNTSTAPIRIVGGPKGCSLQGCISPLGRYPLKIAPGATGTMRVQYVAPAEGHMPAGRHAEFDTQFYVDSTTMFAVPCRITADMAPAPKTEPLP